MKRISLKGLLGLCSAMTLLTLPLLVSGCAKEEKAALSSDDMETAVARAVFATQTAEAEAILGPPKTETAIARTIFATQTAKAGAKKKLTPKLVSPTTTADEKATETAVVEELKRLFATQTAEAEAESSVTETPVPAVATPTDTPTSVPPTATTVPSMLPPMAPTVAPTDTPISVLPTATDTPIPPTDTPMPTATDTPMPTATDTPMPTATHTPTSTATHTPTSTATHTPTPTVDVATCWYYSYADLDLYPTYREGTYTLYLNFGGPFGLYVLDTAEDAQDARALFLRHTRYCRIGHGNTRPNHLNYIVEYFTGNTGTETTISQRDCIPYNPANLRISDAGAEGWRLHSGTSIMALLDNEADARAALALASRHTAHCFIGRGNTRPNRREYIHDYWE